VGGLLTAFSVALVGFFGTQYLNKQQMAETNVRLYAQLMSGREKADSDLRKEMFNSILEAFLDVKGKSSELESTSEKYRMEKLDSQVLALELIAYNFHDVIDLGPLFKHVKMRISDLSPVTRDPLEKRLEGVAREVIDSQIATLHDVAVVRNADVFYEDLEETAGEFILLNSENLKLPSGVTTHEPDRFFTLEVIKPVEGKKELLVRLAIDRRMKPQNMRPTGEADYQNEVDLTFRVGFFDFPMIDNTRLAGGQRVAVVLRKWNEIRAELSLIYFPGSRASLKEKPYYDEVIEELVRTRTVLEKS
jgi:hypothetical protein